MPHQTTLNNRLTGEVPPGDPYHEAQGGAPAEALKKNVGHFSKDLLTLVELQSALFVADAKELGRRTLVPVIMMVIGVVVLLASIPAFIFGLGWYFHESLEFSKAAAFCLAGASGLGITAIFGLTGWLVARKYLSIPQRSIYELRRNFRWLKQSLTS